MFLWWLSLLPLPHNYTTHSKSLDPKSANRKLLNGLSRQRSEQKQSSPLLENSLPPDGRQRTPAHYVTRNCQALLTAHRWKVTDENTPFLDMLPMMIPWVCTHNITHAWRDTKQGLDGTQVLPASPQPWKATWKVMNPFSGSQLPWALLPFTHFDK